MPPFLKLLVFLLISSCAVTPPLPTPYNPALSLPTEDDYRLVDKQDFLSSDLPWITAGKITSWKLEKTNLDITLEGGAKARLSIQGPDVFRWQVNPRGPVSSFPSYAVVNRNFSETTPLVTETSEAIVLDTSGMTIRLNRNPLTLTVLRRGQVLFTETKPLQWTNSRFASFYKITDQDRFYGLGEKTGPLVKNGQSVKNWNSDTYKYTRETDPIYSSIPFWINAAPDRTWGLFLDNTGQSFVDLGKAQKDQGYFGATSGEMDFTFFAQETVPALVQAYTHLTGRMELPPLWALGYQQSRYSYKTQEEVLTVAKTLREKKLPADVIYLDIHFLAGNRSFTWSTRNFPDAKGMMDELHKMNFKTVNIVDPGIYSEDEDYEVFASGLKEDVFIKDEKGEIIMGKVWPGECAFPDFTKPQTATWWGQQYQVLTDLGIDGFWNDMNEPSVFQSGNGTLMWESVQWDFGRNSPGARVHNIYGLTMTQATKAGLKLLRPNNRNFILGRAAYAGSQRTAAIWTGDNTSNWDHLKLNVTMILNLGLSGYSLTGADVGGYTGTPTPELFARWMELGALIPLFRNHTENGTAPQEPWAFGLEAEKASRQALELRYRLQPYLYQLARESSLTGAPIARTLFYEFPQDLKTYTMEDEFLLGPDLLVAPILDEGKTERSVYLPAGTQWKDFYSNQVYQGGTSINVKAPWGKIPLFLRGGAQILTQEPVQYTGEKSGPQVLELVGGTNSVRTIYQDDGISMDYKKGSFRETKVTSYQDGAKWNINLEPLGGNPNLANVSGDLILRLHLNRTPKSISLDGKVLTVPLKEGMLSIEGMSKAHFIAVEF